MRNPYLLQLVLWLALVVTPAAFTAVGFWHWSKFLAPHGRIVRALSIGFMLLTASSLLMMAYAAVLIYTHPEGEELKPGTLYTILSTARQVTRIALDLYMAPLVCYAALRMRRLNDEKRQELIAAHNELLRLKRNLKRDV